MPKSDDRPAEPPRLDEVGRTLAREDDVCFVYVFGSVATGRTHRQSDVDIAIYLEPHATNGLRTPDRFDRHLELIGLVTKPLGRDDVDVVLLPDAPPLLSDRIARSGTLLICRDPIAHQRWLVHTKSRYCDLRFVRDMLDRALRRRIRDDEFGKPHRGVS